MYLETDSNLYGTTVSPYDRDLSACGSSGGEGALLGLPSSCLDIGTDICGKSTADFGRGYVLTYT
jgi:Asp-tRNA(Asn)/Glu-tRNA(Gln) amidotransferase A subunit family amidase